jgi:hypothetical protein
VIRVYLSGNEVHDRVLKAFYDGLPEEKRLVEKWAYEPSDVAVVFGVRKSKVPISFPRGEVISQQRKNNLGVLVLETGYINRGDGENHHYAAGWNGLNGRADFKNKGSPDDRAILLRRKHGLRLLRYRDSGDNVIVCGQVPWDASVDHSDHQAWLQQTVWKLKSLTNKRIVFRPHPLAKLEPFAGCGYSTGSFRDELQNAHAVVTFNSNSGVEALIEGVPVFAADEGSMVWGVCNRYLEDINKPEMHIRDQWINDLAYTQWTPAEMREGLAWKHLSPARS